MKLTQIFNYNSTSIMSHTIQRGNFIPNASRQRGKKKKQNFYPLLSTYGFQFSYNNFVSSPSFSFFTFHHSFSFHLHRFAALFICSMIFFSVVDSHVNCKFNWTCVFLLRTLNLSRFADTITSKQLWNIVKKKQKKNENIY